MNNCEDCKHWQPKTKHRLFKNVSVEGYCKRISENTTYRDSCFRFTPMRFKEVLRVLLKLIIWSLLLGMVEIPFAWAVLMEWKLITPDMILRGNVLRFLGALFMMGLPVACLFSREV